MALKPPAKEVNWLG